MNAKKKAGIVGAGVLTVLVAASPLAWATDHGEDGHDGKKCAFVGGDAGAESAITGGSLGNIVTQAPVGGNNAGNAANCSDFLNNNLNDNLSGNSVSVLSPLPALPLPVGP
ncbi:hypothetical protein [Pseudonocardia endophytica]|uniref:Small secreted domain DUF320 n=1 Tax=Pseudonocardia endophytica TaxID=401976 RepID=A0A4R1HFP0_PSEEN|nr:hypothetical protein [Pseudonocardia endophytica]TCK20954.1 hypothetical protein EV378_4923 [Pseudonocardia endophytica]